MEYGLIGEHLGHSFSKEIHGNIGDYPYEIKELAPDMLERFITEKDFKGINVTIPYKQSVMPYLDYIDERALEIGAVNTIVNKDGRLYGYNTDFFGMQALLLREKMELAGGKVLILGSGGTSHTAEAVAKSLGAASIINVSRESREGAVTYEEAYAIHSDVNFLINTTPCGMYPNIEGVPLDIERFKGLKGVADAIYNPLCSELVLRARKKGIIATGGLFMLVAQAVRASELFFDTKYEDSLIESIYKNIESKKGNIVLTGMPGSGKSTVGKYVAVATGKSFVDTDELIVKKAGMEIADIFKKYGEPYFRDMESEVIKELSLQTGLLISTGGGAVLRESNVWELKRNGKIYFINRPLENIIPTDDRPLSDNEEKLAGLYKERLPIYMKTADAVVDANADVDKVVHRLIEGRLYENYSY